jgi:heat shock protein HslJ
MRTSILVVTLWLLGIGLIVQSCENKDTNIDLTSSIWKIEEVIWSGQSASEKADSLYILEFINDTQYTLGLDVNTCFGKYTMSGNGNIEIKPMGCTEMCCDSEFAANLSILLPKMTKYYEIGERLHFEGDGEIILMEN